MKLTLLHQLILIVLAFTLFNFVTTTKVSAQGFCDTNLSHRRVPAYFLDTTGNIYGETGSSCTNDAYEGVSINRTPVTPNLIKDTTWVCDSPGRFAQGGFEVRTERCSGNPGPLVFDITPPPGFTCNDLSWGYYGISNGWMDTSNNVYASGTGCRVSVPFPPGDWERQVIVQMNRPPVGYFDSINCTDARGWACDPDNYNAALDIHFYADGPIGTGNFAGSTFANKASESLCGGRTNKRFIWAIPSSLKTGTGRSVRPYAMGSNGGSAMLGGSPKFITCAAPPPPPNKLSRTCNNNSITVTWEAVAGADSYTVALDDTTDGVWPGGAEDQLRGGLNTTTYTFPGTEYNRSYRWAVAAYNNASGYSTSSWTLPFTCPPPANTPTPTRTPTPTLSPSCTETDAGQDYANRGTTDWVSAGTPGTAIDYCVNATILYENYCSGTTRIGETHSCAYGCSAGRCNPAPPDIEFNPSTPNPVTRNQTTDQYEIRYCNTGPGPTNGSFVIRVERVSATSGVTQDINAATMTSGQCRTETISCSLLGDEFGGIPCNENTVIRVTLDVNSDINEPGGEGNNGPRNFTFDAVASEPFYKLKDASLHRQGYVDVGISNPLGSIDISSDPVSGGTAEQFLIIGAAGVATSTDQIRVISENGNKVSNKNYIRNSYTNSIVDLGTSGYLNNLDTFGEYISAQKQSSVKTINNFNNTDIQSNSINYKENDLTINGNVNNSKTNFVLFVDGNVTINTPTFNTSGTSIAIIATETITIAPNVTTVNAILIAENVNLGSSNTNTLKINGNLISDNYINITRNVSTPQQRPNVYIVFNPQMYMNLLPYLSDIILEGRQVE